MDEMKNYMMTAFNEIIIFIIYGRQTHPPSPLKGAKGEGEWVFLYRPKNKCRTLIVIIGDTIEKVESIRWSTWFVSVCEI